MRLHLLTGILFLALIAMTFNDGIKGTVVCFGDSITHGAKVDGHSWVYFLSKEHKDINFINEGRNGRNKENSIVQDEKSCRF